VFKGPKHKKQDHIDAIILTTRLMKLLRAKGRWRWKAMSRTRTSAIFAEFPRLLANKALIALICDTLTLIVVSSGTLEVHAVEEVMDNAMKTHFHEMHEPQQRCRTWPTRCPRWASSRRCWAWSRPWARSTSRPRCWAA
jgi:chemotaxis protein MotA